MATIQLREANPGLSGPSGPESPPSRMDEINKQVFHGLGSIESVRGEVDDCLADMKAFASAQPDQVMAAVSGHSARLVEIMIQISRIEVVHRQWKPIRTQEIEPVLAELKHQFSVASRLITVRGLDQALIGGMS